MSTSTSLSVPTYACNHQNLTLFDLSAFKFIETIYIGDTSFRNVAKFVVDGLFKLRSLVIAHDSFSIVINRCESNMLHTCKISNCKVLKTINIGPTTFNDFSGGLELTNLPQLESLTLSDDWYGNRRFSFCYADFYLRSLLSLFNNM